MCYVQIDHGHEVSWLSELREVSVLFINLDPGEGTDMAAAGKQYLLQMSYEAIYPALAKYNGKSKSLCQIDQWQYHVLFLHIPGSFNKVFMFDKVRSAFKVPTSVSSVACDFMRLLYAQGCTFLCIFGLPHAKHEDDTFRALSTAREIFNKLREYDLQ